LASFDTFPDEAFMASRNAFTASIIFFSSILTFRLTLHHVKL
jgi:hypothetical protein